MSFRVGIVVVFASLIIGYLGSGGNVAIILQPFEWLEVIGIAVGIFILSNPPELQRLVFDNLHKIFRRAPYSNQDSLELLSFLALFLKHASISSIKAEKEIENPTESPFFSRIYLINNGKELVTFFCDYFRLVNPGFERFYDLESRMEQHILEQKTEVEKMAGAILSVGDALPALGIIVAVLGVVTAMGAVGAEPAVLGARIASALVGTFVGILLSYGIVTPIGHFLEKFCLEEIKLFEVIKVAIISHASGNAPSTSVEFARQALPEKIKPSFAELEYKLLNNGEKKK